MLSAHPGESWSKVGFAAFGRATLLLLALTSRAGAQEPSASPASPPAARGPGTPMALSWVRLTGAESCPGLDEVARRVEGELKRPVFGRVTAAEVFLEASVEPQSGAGFRVRISMSDREGHALGSRELASASPDCVDAVETAALTLALMIDPNAGPGEADGSTPAPATEAPAEPDAPAPSSTPAAAAKAKSAARAAAHRAAAKPNDEVEEAPPDPDEKKSLSPHLDLALRVDLGQLPQMGAGPLVGVSVPLKQGFGLSLNASYLFPQTTAVGQFAAEFSAASAELDTWLSPARGNTLFFGGQIGVMSASGQEFDPNHDYNKPLLDLGLGVQQTIPLTEDIGLLLRFRVGVPLRRDTFEVGGTGFKFQPSPVTAAIAVGFDFGT